MPNTLPRPRRLRVNTSTRIRCSPDFSSSPAYEPAAVGGSERFSGVSPHLFGATSSVVKQTRRAAFYLPALLLLGIFLLQGIFFIRANSQTVDEAVHLAAGFSYLATGDFRLDDEHPPLIKLLQALPLFVAYDLSFPDPQHWDDRGDFSLGLEFLYGSALSAERMLRLSRLVNLSLGALLIALIGCWSYRLWGDGAALLAMSLASLEPNLVAHSSLVTTDVGVALLMFLCVYLLWEHIARPRSVLLVGTGVAAGLALAAKYSALLLAPIVALIIAAITAAGGRSLRLLPMNAMPIRPIQKISHALILFAVLFLLSLLVIPSLYFFHGLQPWLAGLERFRSLAEAGRPAFYFGEYSYQGWWSYYFGAFIIKTPIGTLLLILASMLMYRRGYPLGRREAIFLLVPVVIFFLAMTQSKVNIGLRHILPVYPFLFVLAGRLATVTFRRRWVKPVMLVAPLIFTAVSALSTAPHQLAYFNELVGGSGQGYRYLSDSNLDWGQDLKAVKAYMEKERLPMIYLSYFGTAPPAYYDIRYQYVPGTWPLEWPPPRDRVSDTASRKILAISVYNLQDVSNAYAPLFRWLWRRQPVAKIGYSIFIYDLTDDPEGLSLLRETYARAGIREPDMNQHP
jgi:hypothetical protein